MVFFIRAKYFLIFFDSLTVVLAGLLQDDNPTRHIAIKDSFFIKIKFIREVSTIQMPLPKFFQQDTVHSVSADVSDISSSLRLKITLFERINADLYHQVFKTEIKPESIPDILWLTFKCQEFISREFIK